VFQAESFTQFVNSLSPVKKVQPVINNSKIKRNVGVN
jgi:hypothetical protein